MSEPVKGCEKFFSAIVWQAIEDYVMACDLVVDQDNPELMRFIEMQARYREKRIKELTVYFHSDMFEDDCTRGGLNSNKLRRLYHIK